MRRLGYAAIIWVLEIGHAILSLQIAEVWMSYLHGMKQVIVSCRHLVVLPCSQVVAGAAAELPHLPRISLPGAAYPSASRTGGEPLSAP